MPGKRLLSEQFVGALTPSLSGGKDVLQLDHISILLPAQDSSRCSPCKLGRTDVKNPDLIPKSTPHFAIERIDPEGLRVSM